MFLLVGLARALLFLIHVWSSSSPLPEGYHAENSRDRVNDWPRVLVHDRDSTPASSGSRGAAL